MHLDVRLALLIFYLLIAVIYTINVSWFNSMKLLSLKPFQRFEWQSEKFGADAVFRISSLVSFVFIISVAIKGYGLGAGTIPGSSVDGNILVIGILILVLLVLNYLVNRLYFSLHRETEAGEEIIDFQYSLNQWFTLALAVLLSVDVFFFRLDSVVSYVLLAIGILYFLARLFGTLLILQDKMHYPILTVFVYLCGFEIAPALVIAKVLFVNT